VPGPPGQAGVFYRGLRTVVVDGIVLPTTRRAYDQLTPDHPLMVAIDMGKITIR